MKSSNRSIANDSTGPRATRRVYREGIMGWRVPVAAGCLLAVGLLAITRDELTVWGTFMFWLMSLMALLLLLLPEVTVDAEAGVVREAWRFLGVLTTYKRERSLRQFTAIQSQRLQVRCNRGLYHARRVYCAVYLMAGAGAGEYVEIGKFKMGKDSGCPEGIAVGQDLARLTGLPFEDRC